MAVLTLVQSLLLCVTAWVFWRYVRPLVMPSPLDNIPGPESQSFWKGNVGQLFHRHTGWKFQAEISEKYQSVTKIHGLCGNKYLYVFDPVALQSIILKDQNTYEEPPFLLRSNHLMFGENLLSTLGSVHRRQRKMLNPVFSIVHMRHMLPVFYGVIHRLQAAIEAEVGDDTVEVDMLNWMGRTALELIGQAGLGYSFDNLVDDVPNAYGDALKALLPTIFRFPVARRIVPLCSYIGPAWLRRLIIDWFPSKDVQKLKNIINTMEVRSKDIYYAKKEALEKGDQTLLSQVGEGKDIMSILLRENMMAAEGDRLPEHELLGQMSSLTFAATDTTSGALAHTLNLLAQYPQIQEKLRHEIVAARDGRELSYDELVNLPYLDAVCREMLRLYPPISMVPRETRKDIMLPLSSPIRGVDGTLMQEVYVPKDTGIIVSILGCNKNKLIWGEDAHEYKPERWLNPIPDKVKEAHIPGVYSNLMTFIGGGRSCIGFKFSQLEMKAVLSILVESFVFELPDKEIVWNLAGVKYPTVGHESTKPQLPLKVSRVRGVRN